jgi:Zn-dependent protease with chaperone function
MTTSGPAIFFDGMTAARQTVTVELGPTALQIRAPGGEALAEWAYGDLAAYSAPDGVLRLGRAKSPVLARLEIHNRDLAAAFDAQAGRVKHFGAVEPRTRVKVVGWSLAAVTSALLVAIFGVPAIVTRVTPLVPVRVEQRLGASVDFQVRSLLDRGQHDRFECGDAPGAQASRAAFDTLVRKLETAALPLPVHASVVRRSEANAIALPGGRVYVFEGLIAKADTPDELAGVIAHEMGHIAHRDGVRAVIQAAGLSFLFGMLIGDFSGGGAAVIAMRTVLQSSYSRDTEAAADAFGAELMAKLERDPRALGAILTRIAGTPGPMTKILLSHPEARERAAAIEAIARAAPAPPVAPPLSDGTGGAEPAGLLTASEWAALKRICEASPQSAPRTNPQAPRAAPHETPGSDRRGAFPRLEPSGR